MLLKGGEFLSSVTTAHSTILPLVTRHRVNSIPEIAPKEFVEATRVNKELVSILARVITWLPGMEEVAKLEENLPILPDFS